ncbi:hypothetical protein GCM10020255_015370 [Rhodococcus baikonurensis]
MRKRGSQLFVISSGNVVRFDPNAPALHTQLTKHLSHHGHRVLFELLPHVSIDVGKPVTHSGFFYVDTQHCCSAVGVDCHGRVAPPERFL